MNRRLEKRHKRQVARARERVKVSTPELRTPEQLKVLREANRSLVGHGSRPPAHYATTATGNALDSPGAKAEEAS
jgi:hypothetical protein